MENEQLKLLIGKYLDGTADDCESKLVEEWYQTFDSSPGATDQLNEADLKVRLDKGFSNLLKSIRPTDQSDENNSLHNP